MINNWFLTPATGIQLVAAQHKTGQRRRHSLANVQKALSSPPKQFRLHNSPMPISPSYKARVPKLKIGSGVISTSGTYVPPTGSSTTYPLLEQKRSSVTILSGKYIIVLKSVHIHNDLEIRIW